MRPIAFTALVLAASLALALASGCGRQAGQRLGIDPDYLAEIETWHAEREAALAAEGGWLSLAGLHPIAPGAQTIGASPEAELRLTEKAPDLIGTLELTEAGELFLETAPGMGVMIGDAYRSGRLPLASDAEGEPTEMELGTLRFYAIERGGEFFLRVKDLQHPARDRFTGVDRFPVEARWRVDARLVEVEGAKGVPVPNVLGQVSEAPSPGLLLFTLDGVECSLRPIAEPGEQLFLVFADGTTGKETYGGGRFLSAPAPDENGLLIIDFNRAVNPPCAFTPYATCPLPPESNILPVAVRAGEKDWGEGH